MKTKLPLAFAVVFLLSTNAFAAIGVGDAVPNLCWKDMNDATVCLGDTPNVVHVLMYNAGYCGPCNAEFDEMMPRMNEMAGKKVVFISLSVADFNGGTPTTAFLKQWQKKKNIPFTVAAAPKSEPYKFDGYGGIPFDVIVDQNGNLADVSLGYEPGVVTDLFNKVDSLLQSR